MMKPEQERVQNLLRDTVTTLCRNSLLYQRGLKVQGLLGITLDDDDVFLVQINEIFQGFGAQEVKIQPADSVSLGVEHGAPTDVSDNSANDGVQVESRRLKTLSRSLHKSRRKARPWRSVGGLTEPAPDVYGKKARLSEQFASDEFVKHEPRAEDDSGDVSQDNVISICDSVEEYAVTSGPEDGDVDIMKQSYMSTSLKDFPDTRHNDTKENILPQLELEQGPSSSNSLLPSAGNSLLPSSEYQLSDQVFPFSDNTPQFSGQGGPFIAGIAQNYPVSDLDAQPKVKLSNLQSHPDDPVIAGLSDSTAPEYIGWDSSFTPHTAGSPVRVRAPRRYEHSCQRPRHNLGSKQQKDALKLHLVVPMVQNYSFNVVPLRVIWRVNEPVPLEETWNRIVQHRHQCDQVISSIDGVGFFISSITGAFSKPHRGRYQNVTVYPAVSYWIVTNSQAFYSDKTYNLLYMSKIILTKLANHYVTVKPINIPMALSKAGSSDSLSSVELLSPPLFVVMKDHTNYFTVNKVTESARYCGESVYSVARFVVVDLPKFDSFLESAVNKLTPLLPGLRLLRMSGEVNQQAEDNHQITGDSQLTLPTGDQLRLLLMSGEVNQQAKDGQQITGNSQQTLLTGDSRQTLPTGDSRQTPPIGDSSQTLGDSQQITGDSRQTLPTRDSRQTLPTGDSRQTPPIGDSRQTLLTGDSEHTLLPAEAGPSLPGGDSPVYISDSPP